MANKKVETNPVETVVEETVEATTAAEAAVGTKPETEAIPELNQEPEVQKAARKEVDYSKQGFEITGYIADEHDILNTDWYTPQERELQEIKNAIKTGRACVGTVFGTEKYKDLGVTVMLKYKETIRVLIPANDFFAYSEMKDFDVASKDEKNKRYQQKAAHTFGAVVSFIPVAYSVDDYGVPFVVASRKAAMEYNRKRFFLAPRAMAAVGKQATASILSTGPRYITIECLGIEATLGVGALSSFEFIEDASKKFKVGTGLPVVIESLEVDKKTGKIDVSFSHAAYERGVAKRRPVNEDMIGGRYQATIQAVKDNGYVAIIDSLKIRGWIPLEKNLNPEPLMYKDKVIVLVTGVDKKKNTFIGGCIKP